jgi:lipoprotein-releasing system permease protein
LRQKGEIYTLRERREQGECTVSEGILPSFEISVVSRHLVHRKWQTALSVAAVCLAVAISIVFVSIQNGFEQFLFDIIFKNLPHITVSPVEGEDYLHLYRA